MTIRTVLNPYGGIPPIVDARIGTAYAIVEICVLNLETITAVANSADELQVIYNNMPSIVAVGNNTNNINLIAADIASVEVVGANMDKVQIAADNIDDITLVADRFETELTSRAQAVAGAIGATVTLPWPQDVTLAKVLASNVCIKGTNGWLYHPGSTTFVATGKSTGLEVVVQTGATAVVGGTILWHITHTP